MIDLSIFDSVEMNDYDRQTLIINESFRTFEDIDLYRTAVNNNSYFLGKFDSKASLVRVLMMDDFNDTYDFYFHNDEFCEAVMNSVDIDKMFDFYTSYARYFECIDGIYYIIHCSISVFARLSE